jgi:hypothetical protein
MCEHIAQAQDADTHPIQVGQNTMYRFGRHILQPNRYPNPPHCLTIPIDHGQTHTREAIVGNKEKGPRGPGACCTPTLALIRGDIPSVAELEEQQEIAHK